MSKAKVCHPPSRCLRFAVGQRRRQQAINLRLACNPVHESQNHWLCLRIANLGFGCDLFSKYRKRHLIRSMPAPSFGDVLQKGSVDFWQCGSQMLFQPHATTTHSERCLHHQRSLRNLIRQAIKSLCQSIAIPPHATVQARFVQARAIWHPNETQTDD